MTHLSTTHKGKFQTQCLNNFPCNHWERWNLCFVFTFGVIVSRAPCLGLCLTTLTVSITVLWWHSPKSLSSFSASSQAFLFFSAGLCSTLGINAVWGFAGDRTQGKRTSLTHTSHWVQSSELQKCDIEDGQFLKCQNYLVLTLWEELVGYIGLEMQHLSSYCPWPSASESNGQG